MENHPIPQDVTGFQFKLIGSMTVKQFALLAVPVVFGFLFYYLPIPFYIKYPFIFLFGVTGLTLAFLPIEGRPADVMIKHFIQAFFAPNQYIYTKEGHSLAFATLNLQKMKQQATVNVHRDTKKEQQLQTYLQDTHMNNNPLDAKETAFLQTLQKYSPAPNVIPTHQASPFALPIHLPKFNIGKNNDVILPPSGPSESPQPKKDTTTKTTHEVTVSATTPLAQNIQHIPTPMKTQTHLEPIMPTPFSPKALGSLPVEKPASPVQPVTVATPQIQQAQYQSTWAKPEEHPQIAVPKPPAPVAPLTQQAQKEVAIQLQKMREEKVRLEKELERLRAQTTAAIAPSPIKAPIQAQPAKPLPTPPPVVAQPVQVTQPQEPTPPVVVAPSAPVPLAAAPIAQPVQVTQPPVQATPNMTQPLQVAPATPHVSKIPKSMAQSLGLPNIPDSPNLITGLVRDPRGNVLPNLLVEVKDKDGNPVRAFKTNQLGQFASATPLMNGTYTITFEDPADKQKFDTIEIHAKGEVIAPISIVSHDAREELRKALFN